MNWLQKIAKKGVKYSHSSVQFDFPKSIATKIQEWGKKHIKNSDLYTEEKKYGRENEIHVTVKYGLITSDIRKIENVIKGIKPFNLKLGDISRFTPKDKEYDVVKIDIESEGLHELNKKLCELKNEDDHPVYKPHCTLAYVKKGYCSELSGNSGLKGIKVKVDGVTFSSKSGEKSKIRLK